MANFLYRGLGRAELCELHVVELQDRSGVRHLRVLCKGSKIRYVPLYPAAAGDIAAYLEVTGHGDDKVAPLGTVRLANGRRVNLPSRQEPVDQLISHTQ